MSSAQWMCLFEFVVNIRRVEDGRDCGSRSITFRSNSCVVVDAGKGRQTVGGRQSPGNVSTNTLIVAAISNNAVDVSSCRPSSVPSVQYYISVCGVQTI